MMFNTDKAIKLLNSKNLRKQFNQFKREEFLYIEFDSLSLEILFSLQVADHNSPPTLTWPVASKGFISFITIPSFPTKENTLVFILFGLCDLLSYNMSIIMTIMMNNANINCNIKTPPLIETTNIISHFI